MELCFLRHGIAESRAAFSRSRDFKRSLTPEGRVKVRRIARAMKTLGLEFDLVWSSPYLRARQTAEIVARVMKLEAASRLAPELSADSTPRRLVRGLLQRELPPRVLLVGHEPLFSETMSLLLVGDLSLAITLKKGSLAMLTMEQLKSGCCATLEWLLTPKQLCRIR